MSSSPQPCLAWDTLPPELNIVSLLILMILTRSGPMADTYQILRESYNYFSDLQFLDSSPRISAVSGFKTCLVGLEPNTMDSAENEDHVDNDISADKTFHGSGNDQWLISSYILSLVVILSLTVNKCGDTEKDQINQSTRKVQSLVLQPSATKMLKI